MRLTGTDNRVVRSNGADHRGNGTDHRGNGTNNRGKAWLTQDLDLPLAVFEELWNRTVGVIGVPEPDPSKRIIKIIRP